MSDQPLPAEFDAALDWLINWAMAVEMDAQAHFFHICDGIADQCGCKFQGDDGR